MVKHGLSAMRQLSKLFDLPEGPLMTKVAKVSDAAIGYLWPERSSIQTYRVTCQQQAKAKHE